MIRIKNVTFGGLSIVRILGGTPTNFVFDIEDWGLVQDPVTDTDDWGEVSLPVITIEDLFADGGFSNEGDPSDPGGPILFPATYNRPTGTAANPFTYGQLFGTQAFTADQVVIWSWSVTNTVGSGASLRVVQHGTGNTVTSPYTGTGIDFSITGVAPNDYEDKRFSITLTATDATEEIVAWNFVMRFQNVG